MPIDGRPSSSQEQNRAAATGSPNPSTFCPPPFSLSSPKRRRRGGLARTGGSPATVRSGAAGVWPRSSPFSSLFSLASPSFLFYVQHLRQLAMAAGGRPRRPRRSPRRCARSPVRGRAAVERPHGGAREPVRARSVSRRRRSAGKPASCGPIRSSRAASWTAGGGARR